MIPCLQHFPVPQKSTFWPIAACWMSLLMRSASNSDCNHAVSRWVERGPEGYKRGPVPQSEINWPATSTFHNQELLPTSSCRYTMTSPTREWRKGFEHKCRTSIERPQDYSVLGSASRPILIDCEDDRASGRDDADGDTIPETPSHRSLSSVCYDSQTHLTLGHSQSAAPTALAGGSPSYGEMGVQRSTHGECASTVSLLVENTESAVQNTRLGILNRAL
ncbi:hypothetical protein BDV33DRAFT_174294 [Aspergillus novoparasiticus]|uniref:Uncharacterized protein n=1 Tax=Aspergillus novoparasiticus TaxID=986946 RepID=A0A5N6EP75_9EURO|nr:hypothetical protein BDV33DRAFT_174294 [Aspergillus novoparasiticus]